MHAWTQAQQINRRVDTLLLIRMDFAFFQAGRMAFVAQLIYLAQAGAEITYVAFGYEMVNTRNHTAQPNGQTAILVKCDFTHGGVESSHDNEPHDCRCARDQAKGDDSSIFAGRPLANSRRQSRRTR